MMKLVKRSVITGNGDTDDTSVDFVDVQTIDLSDNPHENVSHTKQMSDESGRRRLLLTHRTSPRHVTASERTGSVAFSTLIVCPEV